MEKFYINAYLTDGDVISTAINGENIADVCKHYERYNFDSWINGKSFEESPQVKQIGFVFDGDMIGMKQREEIYSFKLNRFGDCYYYED